MCENYSRHCKSTSHQISLFRFLTDSFNSFSIINLNFITRSTRGKTLQIHPFQGIYNYIAHRPLYIFFFIFIFYYSPRDCWNVTNLFVLFFENKLVKGPELQRQNYYPTPPTSVLPNTPERSTQMAVSSRTANALFNVQKGYWQTLYQQQFTGNGPQNILKLDNFDSICRGGPDVLVSDVQEM